MAPKGPLIRAAGCAIMAIISPIAYINAVRFLDDLNGRRPDLLLCALLIAEGLIFYLMLRGKGDDRGANWMCIAIPALTVCLKMALNSEISYPDVAAPLNQTNATEVIQLELLPLPVAPTVPPTSTCRWHEEPDIWPLDLSSYNSSSSPPPSLLPSSTLRSSVCTADMDETKWNKMVSTIGNLDMIAVAAGVDPHEWDGPACKAAIIDAARRATTPYCSSDCTPLGVCDTDCRSVADVCGRMVEYDVLQNIMENGAYVAIMTSMLGNDLAPCFNDVLVWVTGNGDASKICDSASYPFSHMSFGATPSEDCLPVSTDPNSFLRNSSSSSGNCSLSRWDNYGADFDNVTALNDERAAYNEALVLNATNATAAEEIVDESRPRFPSWREPAIVLIPAIMFVLLWVGDRLSIKKKKSDSDNLAAVTP
ncbi:hypothetical protein TeGR_g3637, partial [Tetraparma gracilis]